MLTQHDVEMVAESLSARLGDTAIAAAVLRAQWASASGDLAKTRDWRRIAEQLETIRTSRSIH